MLFEYILIFHPPGYGGDKSAILPLHINAYVICSLIIHSFSNVFIYFHHPRRLQGDKGSTGHVKQAGAQNAAQQSGF